MASIRSNIASMRNCSGSTPPSSLIIEFRRNPVATTWSWVGLGQQVAGELLDDEPVVGQVAVEGVDDPVAIEPDVPRLVLLEPVGVGVPGRVEPVPAPALAVMGRLASRRSTSLLVGVGRRVGEEGVDLRERRRQADQVEAQAADQGGPVGLGRGLQPLGLQPGEDEAVDRVPGPGLVATFGERGPGRGLERPVVATSPAVGVVGPARPLVDPGAEQWRPARR